MLKKTTLLLLMCLFFSVYQSSAEAQLNSVARMFAADLETYLAPAAKKTGLPDNFIELHQLIPRNQTYYAGASLIVKPEVIKKSQLQELGVHIGTQIGSIWTIRFPVEVFTHIRKIPGIEYLEMGSDFTPNLDAANEDARIENVHAGIETLEQAYTGKDVIIAVIDWGFDYTHPQFFDALGEKYRIMAIWDQNNIERHRPPHNFNYGTFYTKEEHILEYEKDDDYIYGPFSHGTHVGGIAGGSGFNTPFKGAAPESDLIFISLRRDAPSLIDAYYLIDSLASKAGKPYVVNMSFGGHFGPHDATDLENRVISKLAGPGKIFVSSAGNNGNTTNNSNPEGFHLEHDFYHESDTLRTFLTFGHTNYQTLSVWGTPGADFKTRIKVYNSFGMEILKDTGYFHTADDFFGDIIYTMDNENEKFEIRVSAQSASPLNGAPNQRIEIKRSSSIKNIAVEFVADSGKVHMWSCMREETRYANWATALKANLRNNDPRPWYKDGDDHYGVGEPGAVGKDVITVAAHTTKRSYTNTSGDTYNNPHPGELHELALFSSRGPTADGRIKPEISAPGNMVVSSWSSFDNLSSNAIAAEASFRGKTYYYTGISGTSMSGPYVAGVVALMLEANPLLAPEDVRKILIETAINDQYTGEIDGINNEWGAGKVNAYEAVKMAETYEVPHRPAGPGFIPASAGHILVYPNPNHGDFYITAEKLSEPGTEVDLTLRDQLGRVHYKGSTILTTKNLAVAVEPDKPLQGIYFLTVQWDDKQKVVKVIVQ